MYSLPWTRWIAVALSITLLAADACADAPDELVLEEAPGDETFVAVAPIDDDRDPFAQGTWSVSAYGGWIGGDSTQIGHGHVAVAFHPLDRFAVALDGGVYDISLRDLNAPAGSIDVVLRYYLVVHEWVAAFVDLGAGVMGAGLDLPTGTSWWNFTPQARLGVALEIAPHLHVIAAGGWWHASTAGLERPNPGYNGAQAWGGLMITP